MKKHDFSHLGGFPLSQEALDHMQSSYVDAIKGLAAIVEDSGTDIFILSGCIKTGSNWSAGWLYYFGDVIYFAGGPQLSGAPVDRVEVVDSSTLLTYNDASTHAGFLDSVAGFANTGIPEFFLMGSIPRYRDMLGKLTETDAWTDISITTAGNGAVTGTLSYRKNVLSQSLHIKGNFLATDAQAIANPLVSSFIGPLPVGYRPAADSPIYCTIGSMGYVAGYIPEVNTTEHITHIRALLATDGKFFYYLPKPTTGVASYYFLFNAIIPLL